MRRLLFLTFFIFVFPNITFAQNVGGGERICQAVSVSGEVMVETGGENQKLKVGDFLRQGARVTTSKDSFAVLAFDEEGKNIMQVGENSSVTIKSIENNEFLLRSGELLAKLKNLKPGESFEIQSPVVVAAVRGTEYGVTYIGGNSEVSVFDHKVEVFNLDWNGKKLSKGQFLEKGNKLEILKGGQFGKLQPLQAADWKRQELFGKRSQDIPYRSIRKAHPYQAKREMNNNPYERSQPTVAEEMAQRGIRPEEAWIERKRQEPVREVGYTLPQREIRHKKEESPAVTEEHHEAAAPASRETSTASPAPPAGLRTTETAASSKDENKSLNRA